MKPKQEEGLFFSTGKSGIDVKTVESLACTSKPNPAGGEHKEGQERE